MSERNSRAPAPAASGGNLSPEDVILLQSTVVALRQERDSLLRRLQMQEAAAREKVHLAEARLREAQAQVEALKRATQQVRAQLEEALSQAQATAENQRAQASHWQQRYHELASLVEAAQCRIADLETENEVLTSEVQRLEKEREGAQHQLDSILARVAELERARQQDQEQVLHWKQQAEASFQQQQELEQALLQARQQLQEFQGMRAEWAARLAEATQRHAQLEEACAHWAERAREREAALAAERALWEEQRGRERTEWQQERDAIARSLEEAQNRTLELEREIDRTRAALCSVQMREQSAADEIARLEHELKCAAEERAREREILEHLIEQRRAEQLAAEEEWRRRLEEAEAAAQLRIAELEARFRATEEQFAELRANYARAEQRIAELAEALCVRDESLASAARRTADLEAALAEVSRSRSELEEALEQLRHDSEAHRQAAQQARAQLESARTLLASARAELALASRAYSDQLLRHNEQVLSLLDERGHLERSCLHLQALLAESRRRLEQSTVLLHVQGLHAAQAAAAREQLEAQLRDAQHWLEAQRTAYEDAIRWRECERVGLAGRLAEQVRALGQLWEACSELARAMETLQAERDSFQQSLTREAAAAAEARERLHSLEAELFAHRDRAAATIESLQGTLAQRDRDLLELRESLEASQQARLAAEERQQALQAEFLEVSNRLSSLQEEYASLCETIGSATAQFQQRIAALEEELARAQDTSQELALRIAEYAERERELEARLASREEEVGHLRFEVTQVREQVQREREARGAAEEIAAEAKRQWEALQEQAVSILQGQEVLANENDALRRAQQELELQLDRLLQEREQAVRAGTEAARKAEQLQALLLHQQREFAAVRQQLDSERTSLRDALEAARAQQAQLTAQVTQLQQEVARAKERRGPAASFDLVELERERTELRAQVEKLSAVIRQLGQEREEQRVAALQAQAGLNARIEELAAERSSLALRVAELETLSTQLERECDRLRRERLSPEELRRHKAEIARLEARVEELERLRAEATQNHSAVVANYMLELNQRAEALQQKEAEIQQLRAELTAMQQMYEELQLKLDQERDERNALSSQLDELRRTVGSSRSKAATKESPERETKPVVQLRFADSSVPAPAKAKPALVLDGATIVHLEESREYREAIQRLAKSIPNSRYWNTLDVQQLDRVAPLVLVVNLLNRAHDPIAAITHASADDPTRHVFAYCAEGKFGFFFGPATFFPAPLEPSTCAAWLMGNLGAVHKVLVASNDIEMTSQLRTELNRVRCSTSVALDLRQVLDLLPLIQPDVVLVDLSLPRAEGLRLVSRLRSDEKTARLPLAVLLPPPQKVSEFRQTAQRAAREGTLTPATLLKAVSTELGVPIEDAESATEAMPGAKPQAS